MTTISLLELIPIHDAALNHLKNVREIDTGYFWFDDWLLSIDGDEPPGKIE